MHPRYYFSEQITPESVERCQQQLDEWTGSPTCQRKVEVQFTAPGGSVTAAFRLIRHIEAARRRGSHVTTTTSGMASAISALLLQAGDVRVIHSRTFLPIRQPDASEEWDTNVGRLSRRPSTCSLNGYARAAPTRA